MQFNKFQDKATQFYRERQHKKAKELLQKTMESRVLSSFIHALSEFEKEFGEMWGHFIEDDNKLSDEQFKNYEKYEELRKRILDYGNNQKRLIQKDLSNFNVEYIQEEIILKEMPDNGKK